MLPHLVLPDEVAEGRLRVEGEGGGDLGRYRAEQYHLLRVFHHHHFVIKYHLTISFLRLWKKVVQIIEK